MAKPDSKQIDLHDAFLRRQTALAADLRVPAAFTTHGTTIGDASEADWHAMVRSVLPARYGVAPLFAVDTSGAISEQIDLGIYDQQYSPLFFRTKKGVLVVPAESVYAVFEVKQKISKRTIEYALDKAASVRRLLRTSAAVHHLQGKATGKKPENMPILAGLLAAHSGYKNLRSAELLLDQAKASDTERLDLGIALDQASFDLRLGETTFSPDGAQLIFLALRLFRRLQPLATALAPDMDAYEAAIFSHE